MACHPRCCRALAQHLGAFDVRRSAETGAGGSTLLFSQLSAQHTAFAIDGSNSIITRLKSSLLLRKAATEFVEGPTQWTLPKHTFEGALQAVSVFGEIGNAVALRIGRLFVQIVLFLFLLDNARHPLLDNWVRPLRRPKSVLRTPRAEQYFADMSQWNNSRTYEKTVDFLTHINCGTIGIDITKLQLEYPLQALLRETKPGTLFVHTGVQNVSVRYRQPVDAPACSVVCLDCAGDAKRILLYSGFRKSALVDQCVIFQQE